ncbi:STAS domain-containing protein [Planobispora rosea]|nr:STAS domain-containing protein [Planobispora rosea]
MTVATASPPSGVGSSAPTVIRLSGEIDILTRTALRRRLLSALHYSTNLLVLDLSEVSFCDASGLSALIDVQRRARTQGITLVLTAPSPCMSRILHITGLDRSMLMAA